MPLSRDEQRALDEIERALLSDDPDFAHRVRYPSRLRPILASAGVLLALLGGLAMVTIGLVAAGPAQVAAAVGGFALLVGSCWGATIMLRREIARRRS